MTVSPIIEAQDVSRNFPTRQGLLGRQRDVWALRGINLSISRGETLGVVGESGCGKSTLGNILLGLDTPTDGGVRFEGRFLHDVTGSKRRAMRQRMQLIFQDPFGSLDPRRTIGSQIADGLRNHDIVPTAQIEAEVARLLTLVGLDTSAAKRRPHEFSGGQRQRIAVARALAPRPDFIVADEPVSALDVSIQAQIVNLLADLRRDLDLAMLFISHDLHVVRHLCTRMVVMYLGRIVEEGPTEQIFSDPRHPYTQALLAATPSLKRAPGEAGHVLEGELPSPANPPSGCAFRTRCPLASPGCAVVPPDLKPLGGDGRRLACIKPDLTVNGGGL